MAWKDGFVIEYRKRDKKPTKISCKMCVQYDLQGFCKFHGSKLTDIGYDSWLRCKAFQLAGEYRTESRQRYIDSLDLVSQRGGKKKSKPKGQRPAERVGDKTKPKKVPREVEKFLPRGASGSVPRKPLVEARPQLYSELVKESVKFSSPEELRCDSLQAVKWSCPKCGGRWKMGVAQRVAGGKCPYCSHAEVLPGFNDLTKKAPVLANEWSDENTQDPREVLFCSKKKYLWECARCGTQWKASPLERTESLLSLKSIDDCPKCGSSARKKTASVAATQRENARKAEKTKRCQVPEQVQVTLRAEGESKAALLESEWLSARNDGRTFQWAMGSGALKRVWWRAECGHEFKASARDRMLEPLCPVCARTLRQRIAVPEVGIDAKTASTRDVLAANDGEGVSLPWRCKRGHSWIETLSELQERGCCPECGR